MSQLPLVHDVIVRALHQSVTYEEHSLFYVQNVPHQLLIDAERSRLLRVQIRAELRQCCCSNKPHLTAAHLAPGPGLAAQNERRMCQAGGRGGDMT